MRRKMQKVACNIMSTIAVVAVLMVSGTARSQTDVTWKGIAWDVEAFYPSQLTLINEADKLEVAPSRPSQYGAAHHRTAAAFRSGKTPWVQAEFVDDPAMRSSIQLWMLDAADTSSDLKFFITQIGAWDFSETYMIFWRNLNNGKYGWVNTGMQRTKGQRKVKLGMNESGAVEYWLDDQQVWTNTNITPDSFGDIYLAAQYTSGTFVDYQTGTDYGQLQVVEVDLDVKPGGNHNSINLKSRGVVPVALLSSSDFDATSVDPKSLLFAEAGPVRWNTVDVDEDGDVDLLCHFRTQELNLDVESTEAVLTGTTYNGMEIKGVDSVRIVPTGQEGKKTGK